MKTNKEQTEFKGYLFYRGEDTFFHDSDDAMENYFFCQEMRHYMYTHRESSDNKLTFVDRTSVAQKTTVTVTFSR